MSRPRTLHHRTFGTRFVPVDTALILYYAWKYGKDTTEILRGMVSAYINADEGFDPDEFTKFVNSKIPDLLDDSPEELAELKKAAKAYASKRKNRR